MAAQIAIFDSPDILHLSEEAQAALRAQPGSRISVLIEDGKVTLQPAAEEHGESVGGQKTLDDLCGIFSSTPGLEDDLKEWRRQDKW
ncbi:MAG TPA: hypothetical protein VG714_05190 [Acidobacteriaceae bacterium]|nr:hypothetical protein [Acidobacteriaceae bacterium]